MTLTLNSATSRLSREMLYAETAISDALVATTALMHSAALAYRDVGGTSPAATQATFLRLQKITGGLIEAHGEATRAHGQLLKIAVETGATEEPTCPEKELFTVGENSERLVG